MFLKINNQIRKMTISEYDERKLREMDDLVNSHLEQVYYDTHSKWCIGVVTKKGWLLCSLPGTIVFQYDKKDVDTFIKQTLKSLYNCSLPSTYTLDIVKIDPSLEEYCIRKTYWLKIIQRKWKTKMQEYRRNILSLQTTDCLMLRELNGRHTLFNIIKRNKLIGLLRNKL